MKEKWNEYWKLLEKTNDELQFFLENGGLSTISIGKAKKLIDAWNKQKKLAGELDQYITPVDPVEVKIPFQSNEFIEMWDRWKKYLQEQFGQQMKSRAEMSAIEYMTEISKDDDKKAVQILRYAMANRYRNFFEIDEKTTKQPAKGENKQSDFD